MPVGKYDALIQAAKEIRESAYAPYSGYQVGAALLGRDGRIFTGVNIESASYPAGICAERSALAAAVTAGVRKFTALAVYTEDGGAPCGLCRQALAEFGDMWIICAGSQSEPKSYALSALLPEAFQLKK